MTGYTRPAKASGSRVVAVVCAYDNATEIGATVSSLLGAGVAVLDRVLVVDDGSSDGTADLAREAGAHVLVLGANVGKGSALAAGIEASPDADYYLLVDADVGPTAVEALALVDPVLAGEADMVVGRLPGARSGGGFGLVRRVATVLVGWAGGHRPDSPLSGQRALTAALARSVQLAPRFGVDAALTADALRTGATVIERDVSMGHRERGRGVAGFTHRARQGVDVVRAMWPRLTTPALRCGLVAAAAVLSAVLVLLSGADRETTGLPIGAVARVVVVSVPGLDWTDLASAELAGLRGHLNATGAVGAMNVRTAGEGPDLVDAYATLGAGARVDVGPSRVSVQVLGGSGVVDEVAGIRLAAGAGTPSLPGALGTALADGGLAAAVVATADVAPGLVGLDDVATSSEAAALAVMDSGGRVAAAFVEPDEILADHAQAAFGVVTDPAELAGAIAAAMAEAELVMVDSGDLTRVGALTALGAPEWFTDLRRAEALAALDTAVALTLESLPPGTRLLVISPVPRRDEWRLTPVLAFGSGVESGRLHSPSTRRPGLVTLTDLAPTVLAGLGLDAPSGMVGAPLRQVPGPLDLAGMERLDADAAYRERVHVAVAGGAVGIQLLGYAAVAALVARRSTRLVTPGRRRAALMDLMLAFAAFPLAAVAFRATFGLARPLGGFGVAVLVAIDLAVVAVVRRFRRTDRPLAPLAWVLGLTAVLMVLDLATGARLQLAGILGYSPQSAGRYYGLANTGFAALATAVVVALALHVHHAPRRAEAIFTSALALGVVALVVGASDLGADVGGLATMLVVGPAVVWALAGRRVRPAVLVAGGIGAGVVLVLVALAASATAPEEQSHLGRLTAETLRDGPGRLVETVERKVGANTALLRTSAWAWAAPAVTAALAFLLINPRQRSRLTPAGPVRVGALAGLAVGVVGFALNDSGVVVMALSTALVAPVVATVVLSDDPDLASAAHYPPRRLLAPQRGTAR